MRIFISYARKNKRKVKKLVSILHRGGHQPWFDEELIAGIRFADQVLEEIQSCDCFIYVLTPKSIKSQWCQWELAWAVRESKPIIPVWLTKSQHLVGTLSALNSIQSINFSGRNRDEATAALMRGIDNAKTALPHKVIQSISINPPSGMPERVRMSWWTVLHQIITSVLNILPAVFKQLKLTWRYLLIGLIVFLVGGGIYLLRNDERKSGDVTAFLFPTNLPECPEAVENNPNTVFAAVTRDFNNGEYDFALACSQWLYQEQYEIAQDLQQDRLNNGSCNQNPLDQGEAGRTEYFKHYQVLTNVGASLMYSSYIYILREDLSRANSVCNYVAEQYSCAWADPGMWHIGKAAEDCVAGTPTATPTKTQ